MSTAELIPSSGALAECSRCHAPLRVASSRRTDPNPSWAPRLRLADKPAGVCAGCSVRMWFHLVEPVLETHLHGTPLPGALRLPHVQDTLLRLFALAHSDEAVARDIDWPAVIANWDLPIPGAEKRSRHV